MNAASWMTTGGGVVALAMSLACGGKAVIDGEPGAGGTSSNVTSGGSGGTPSTGGGGSGAGMPCNFAGPYMSVLGDGADQRYEAAGPDPTRTFPTGRLILAEGGTTAFEAGACLSNTSTNACIEVVGQGLSDSGEFTTDARIEYTADDGIVFIGDRATMALDFLGPNEGDEMRGYYEGEVFASGGADNLFLYGEIKVCRAPDLVGP